MRQQGRTPAKVRLRFAEALREKDAYALSSLWERVCSMEANLRSQLAEVVLLRSEMRRTLEDKLRQKIGKNIRLE